MHLHLHEYASGVRGEVRVYYFEHLPPIPSSRVPVNQGLGFPGGIRAFNANLDGTYKVDGLSQCLR